MNRTFPLILCRHGEAEGQAGGGRGDDAGLSDLGRRQAQCLAERLKAELGGAECALFCSDLRRAFETALVVGSALGIRPAPLAELREFDRGAATGRSAEEIAGMSAPAAGSLYDWQPFPGAETWRGFYRRTTGCLERLAGGARKPALVVAHGGVIVNAIHWWLGMESFLELNARIAFEIGHASVTVLGFDRLGGPVAGRINDSAHLTAPGLAPGLGGITAAAAGAGGST